MQTYFGRGFRRLEFQATKITGNNLAINAGTINGQTVNSSAQLNIDAAIESQNQSHTSQGSDLMTQNTANSGKISQSLNYTTINLSNSQNASQNSTPSPTLNATGGIVLGASNLPNTGSKSFRSARALLAGIELMHMIKKSQVIDISGNGLSTVNQFYALAA